MLISELVLADVKQSQARCLFQAPREWHQSSRPTLGKRAGMCFPKCLSVPLTLFLRGENRGGTEMPTKKENSREGKKTKTTIPQQEHHHLFLYFWLRLLSGA